MFFISPWKSHLKAVSLNIRGSKFFITNVVFVFAIIKFGFAWFFICRCVLSHFLSNAIHRSYFLAGNFLLLPKSRQLGSRFFSREGGGPPGAFGSGRLDNFSRNLSQSPEPHPLLFIPDVCMFSRVICVRAILLFGLVLRAIQPYGCSLGRPIASCQLPLKNWPKV